MMLVALALQAAVPVLGPIGRQDLPAHGCAAYLWRAGEASDARGVVARVSTDPAVVRVVLDGKPLDLAREAMRGDVGFGLSADATYRQGGIVASLDLTVATRADLIDGATVPQATLTLAREGGDAVVVPLAGLVGCRRATPAGSIDR